MIAAEAASPAQEAVDAIKLSRPRTRQMKVIYIAGTSHSGSTLLDLMLNAHPQIVSVGEVVNLHRHLAYKNSKKKTYRPCSCGAPSPWACEFWSGVNERMQQTVGKSLLELNLLDHGSSSTPDAAFFAAIAKVSGKDFIVDSSKLPSRLARLMRNPELEVYPIHLVRNPSGQIYSMTKKYGGFLKHIVRYEYVHDQIHRTLRSVPHCVVHYENLVLQPEQTLSRVLAPLGLEFDPSQLSWAEQVKHTVAGNRMRRQQESQLVLDEKWKHSLTRIQKSMINIGTLRSKRALPKAASVPEKG